MFTYMGSILVRENKLFFLIVKLLKNRLIKFTREFFTRYLLNRPIKIEKKTRSNFKIHGVKSSSQCRDLIRK